MSERYTERGAAGGAVDSVVAVEEGAADSRRRPWSLALIDVTVTVVMVALVLTVLRFASEIDGRDAGADDAGPATTRVEPLELPAATRSAPPAEAPEPLLPYLDTVAAIEGDEHRQRDLVLVGQGWVETLAPLRVGERVRRGQRLMTIYSPTLIDLQMEYIDAVEKGDPDAIADAFDHLLVYGQSQQQIAAVLTGQPLDGLIAVHSPSDGVVSALYVREGMFVPMAAPLVRLVDMSSVWMEAELLALDARGIEPGSRVEATLPDGTPLTGIVEYVEYPGRSGAPVRVRMRFDGLDLPPPGGDFADVRIYRSGL